MAITLGAIYASTSAEDPSGQVGFAGKGSLWLQTDTYNVYVRDVLNTSWVLLGITNTQNLGLVPKSGAALTGALTGATGLMQADGTVPFTSAPTVTSANSSNVATLNDLANLQSNIYSLVTATVQQAMAALPTAGINANMAFASGIYVPTGAIDNTSFTFQLPTPVYSDGTTAPISDCIGRYTVALMGCISTVGTGGSDHNNTRVVETTPNSMNFTITNVNTTGVTNTTSSLGIAYFVVAIKPGS